MNQEYKAYPEDEVFTYTITKGPKVMIYYHGKQVTILQGNQANRFIEKMDRANARESQQIMAKATGNFKRGNERAGKEHGKK